MANVYLCKSNQCDPDLVSAARRHIEKFTNKVLEHKGGTYNPNLVTLSDTLIVVPMNELSKSDRFVVGKGQLSEIKLAQERRINVKVFVSEEYKYIGYLSITDIHVFDEKNFQKCAYVYIRGKHDSYNDVAEIKPVANEIKPAINNDEDLLLL